MVVCAVKLCRNYTGKNIKPPEGISFHRFPNDEEQKQEWIRAIQREPEWVPGTHCRVCSVHFEASDFKISETGRRILHKEAVPTKNLYREEREDSLPLKRRVLRSRPKLKQYESVNEKPCWCVGCLAVHPGMARLSGALADAFRTLIDGTMEMSPSEVYPQNVCQICCALLLKLTEFKTRVQTAQEILQDLTSQHIEITPDYLLTIDRERHNLTFPLSVKKLPQFDVSEFDVKQEHDKFDIFQTDNSLDITEEEANICQNVESVTDVNVTVGPEDENDMSNDAFDIFDDKNDLTDLTEQKLFGTDVKIENNQFVLENEEGKSKVYASIVPKHEIFVDVNPKKALKKEKKRKSEFKKKKKIKKEKELMLSKKSSKEDIRNTKPRKTDEDYENFAREHSVDIVTLTREEQIAEVVARKESDNYKNSRYKCEQCYKGFTGEAAFQNHKAIHDPSIGAYVCEACKFRFPKRYKLLHHVTQHKMNFICKLCGHVSKLASKAMEHFKWHNGVKYPCHYCDRVFIKRTSQFNHMRNRHGSSVCDICQEIFSGERGLMAHMQKAHKEAVRCRCEACGVQFHSEVALHTHVDALPHGGCDGQVKACAECGANFPSEDELNEHMKSNHWKEIKCEKCNANFENEKLYRMHRVLHKETRVRRSRDVTAKGESGGGGGEREPVKGKPLLQKRMCEMCGLTWRSAAALRYHQRVHTGEKPHHCPICPKSFRIQDSLQIHMNTHTGARPFKCPLCPKAFKSRTQNHKHQLVHTKVRRYRCDLCDKTFQTSTCVKTHIRAVHMKLPPPPRAPRRRPNISHEENLHYPQLPQHDHMKMNALQPIIDNAHA